MNKKQIKDRINYLKMELAHEGYHDGWTLQGLKEEFEWLTKELERLDAEQL